MTCADVRPLLPLLAVGDLDAGDRSAVDAHLADCAACRAELRDCEQLHAGLRAAFRAGLAPPAQPRRWRVYPLAAAASLLLAVGLWAWLKPGTALPPLPPVVQVGGPGRTTLVDGTEVWASADAQWKQVQSRALELTAGELWAKVAPAEAPFTVHTTAAVATAVGTEFFIDVRPLRHAGPGGPDVKIPTIVSVAVLAGVVTLHNSFGTVTGSRGEALAAEEQAAPKKQVEDLALRFAKYYQPVKVKAQARIPAYTLPLDTKDVANYADVVRKLELKADIASLKANGFAVLPWGQEDDIVRPYRTLKQAEVPVFVTADTLLHLYHLQFDETLKQIEEREFYPDIVALTQTLLSQLAAEPLPADNENFREAQRKALTYLAVAVKALKPNAVLPKQVAQKDVDLVLEKMQKHEGFWPQPEVAHQQWPLFRYAEDFSQYVPRGHYTRSDDLKKYFTGMMWLGRMTFLLKGDPVYGPDGQPALVSVAESNQQTIAAAMLTKLLNQVDLPDKRKARDVWERMYVVTSFYVGLADDLGQQQYRAALEKVCGAALDLGALAGDKKMLELKAELARHAPPAIYSGTGGQSTAAPDGAPEDLVKALNKSMGYRFMGQRFVPDSHMMGRMVFPTVGRGKREDVFSAVKTPQGVIRGFPRGLDVMAVLGSKRAREITRDLGDDAYVADEIALSYDQALQKVQKEYAGLSDGDWNRNLYWSWLHALKPLLAEHGVGHQTFMTTEAYRTKSLNTALASWAQLRHDTILYAKQSYTLRPGGLGPKPVQGYVEPVPEFYARLLALSRMTSKGLGEMKVLDKAALKRLQTMEGLLERLLAIAEKELANEELTEKEYEFIRTFGDEVEKVLVTEPPVRKGDFEEVTKPMQTTLIADVHTDQNSKKVLEVGTGYVELGLFVYKQPDGRLVVGAGPVLSFYEFKHPMSDRLTDEKWRDMLKAGKAPEQPEWTKAYRNAK